MRLTHVKRPIAITAAAAFVALVFAGCGGGGGGGGGTSTPSTVTLTGTLDYAGGTSPAADTTVSVEVSATDTVTATSNSSGAFSLAGVPSGGTVTLFFADSTGASEGSASVNMSSLPLIGSSTKNAGKLSVTQITPPPPPVLSN